MSRQNLMVVAYTLIGWPLGIWLLTRDPALALVGVLLTAHTLVYSAYLIHDCVHHAVFTTAAGNDRLGRLMSWINGACLADYSRLKKKHLRHHSDRLDVVTFDYRAALNRAPGWLRSGVLMLEWAYIPAVEILMRGMIVVMPFNSDAGAGAPGGSADPRLRRWARLRVVTLLAIRVACFAALALISPRALVLYALAYLIFLTVLRFLDAFQHTYEVFASHSLESAPIDPRRDLRYEYQNTYSNLLAERHGWLNLLVLNFPYHNAHHVRPGLPWHKLRSLHASLYGMGDAQVITCRQLLASYHRHRVARVLAADYGQVAQSGDRAGRFLGAVGVSFLTAV
jgi:fatty acid desaturase